MRPSDTETAREKQEGMNKHRFAFDAQFDLGNLIHRFNQFLSDRIPLRRAAPDVRHDDCRKVQFDIAELPATSVIILFHNEGWVHVIHDSSNNMCYCFCLAC